MWKKKVKKCVMIVETQVIEKMEDHGVQVRDPIQEKMYLHQ